MAKLCKLRYLRFADIGAVRSIALASLADLKVGSQEVFRGCSKGFAASCMNVLVGLTAAIRYVNLTAVVLQPCCRTAARQL
ncbi:MAG: hypothetical protein BM562_18575 [Alphaproteobacteria bacterium MedPE-SWcel]|nr:MAG: hypothetical protein BM562_18575 [Alphaproteobacteria bacterium MedPE-SWcel]